MSGNEMIGGKAKLGRKAPEQDMYPVQTVHITRTRVK